MSIASQGEHQQSIDSHSSGRQRLMGVAEELLSKHPPSAISGRRLAREANVHPTFVGQCFASLSHLFDEAHAASRNRFLGQGAEIDPLERSWAVPFALSDHPQYWRANVHLMLDEVAVDLTHRHPTRLVLQGLREQHPRMGSARAAALAAAWWSIQIGALVFERPLRQGFDVSEKVRPAVRRHLDWLLDTLVKGEPPKLRPSKLPDSRKQLPLPGPAEGRQGAERALLEAAMTLFRERADVGVSGRELARLADVNYGLIHHYFGSKDAVFDQAFVLLHSHYVTDVMGVPPRDRFARLMRHESFLRGWAARELAGLSMPTIELTGMRALLDGLIVTRQIDRRDRTGLATARGDAYATIAMGLGWAVCHGTASKALATDGSALLSRLLSVKNHILER